MPALIAFARNKEGDITGGQQIILNSKTLDKAEISVPKRSFGKISSSFVNLGHVGDNSEKSEITIIAEGIETGLSVKQALREHSEIGKEITKITKIEILCSLGINNIKNYDASPGQKIVIAADYDKVSVDANIPITAKTIETAQKELESKGAFVEVACPSIEGDFNDVLQDKENGGSKIVAKAFNSAIVKHGAKTLEEYLGASGLATRLDEIDRSNLNLIQQYNVPENQIVDSYRRSDIDGKIELDRTRKSLESELEKLSKARSFVEANKEVLDDARKFGYGEDYADVAHSLVGMDEKAAKEYCSRIRDSHLSEYLDKNIRDFNQAKHNMLGMDMEKMKSLMSQEQEFLKEVYKSIRSPIKDYSYECRSKLEEAKTAYEKPELLEKSFALIDKLEDEFKVGPKTIAFEVGHLSDIELTFLSLEKCYEYKNCYTMPELNREQRILSQSLNELFSAIEKEHKHLASLHGNIKHNDHDVLLLSRVERFFVKSQGNDLSDLKEISSRALVNGVKTEKELLDELRETNDLKDAYTSIDQNIENHYINSTLERFEHDKQHAKTPDEIFSIIKKEQDFLSSQHNNIKYPEGNIEVTEKAELAYSQKKDNRFDNLPTPLYTS